MAKTKTAVAVAAAASVMLTDDMNNVPEYLRGGTGRGNEEVGTKDITLPRLEIIQSQSPIKDEQPDVAKEGLMFNSVTKAVLGDAVYFVPVFFRTEYLVWKDQDEGGGFFGSFPTEAEAERRRREVVADGENPEFLEVVDTPVHFGLQVDVTTGKTQQLVIAMAKSKARVSRQWNSVIQMCGGDRFSRLYRFGTFKDKNKQGKTFYNYTVQPAGFPTQEIHAEALALYDMFKTQTIKANHEVVVENGDGAVHERGDI